MNHKSRCTLMIISVCLSLLAACAKKSEEADTTEAAPPPDASAPAAAPGQPPAAASAETLPGASSVRAALEKKDYNTAVGALLALRGAANTPERTVEYGNLFQEVRDTLMAAPPTDQRAQQALMTLRASVSGR